MSQPAVVELAIRTCKNLNQSLLLSCGCSDEASQLLQGELSPPYPVCYRSCVYKKQCELCLKEASLGWESLSQRSFHLLKCKSIRIYIHDTGGATALTGPQSWLYLILILKISWAAGSVSDSCWRRCFTFLYTVFWAVWFSLEVVEHMEELPFACQSRALECLGSITSPLAYESRLFRELHKKNSPTSCSACDVWCYHNLQYDVTLN